jgi:hypothetical protein
VTDVRLCATDSQRHLARAEHNSRQRANLDRVPKGRPSAVGLVLTKCVNRRPSVVQCRIQQSLLCLAVWSRQTR